ncbi:MAG: hypothetical protein IJ772_05465 [Bacilli bacterium]|nr:hypothetical protein [Bacilli bacterium]
MSEIRKFGQGLDEYVFDSITDRFLEKLDAVIEKSDQPKLTKTNEEIIRESLQSFKPRNKKGGYR